MITTGFVLLSDSKFTGTVWDIPMHSGPVGKKYWLLWNVSQKKKTVLVNLEQYGHPTDVTTG